MNNKLFKINTRNFSLEALALDLAILLKIRPELITNPTFIQRLSLQLQYHQSYPANIHDKLFSSLRSKTISNEDYEDLKNSLVSHFNSIPIKSSADINNMFTPIFLQPKGTGIVDAYDGFYVSPVGNVTFQLVGYCLKDIPQDSFIYNSYTTYAYATINSEMYCLDLNPTSYPNSPDKNKSYATREQFNKLGILTSYSHISTISDTSRKTTYTRDPKCPFIVEITSPEGTKYMVVSASSFNNFHNADNNETYTKRIGNKYFSSKREAKKYLETCQQALVTELLNVHNAPNIKKFLEESGFDINSQVH